MSSKVDVDPNLDAQLRAIAAQYGRQLWYRPAGLSADPTDPAAVAAAYQRDATIAGLIAAITNTSDLGVTGDLVLAAAASDYLAIMQRAMMARHGGRRPQAELHGIATAEGMSDPSGVLIGSVLSYFQRLSQEAKL